MKRKKYKNTIETSNNIQNALIELIKEGTPYNQITIQLLSEKAKINRGTFYNHYENIDAVINEIEKEYFDFYQKEIQKYKANDLIEQIDCFFDQTSKITKKYEDKISCIAKALPNRVYSDLYSNIFKEFCTTYMEKVLAKNKNINLKEITAQTQILTSGICLLYINYFLNKTFLSLDDICKEAKKILIKYTNEILVKNNNLEDN